MAVLEPCRRFILVNLDNILNEALKNTLVQLSVTEVWGWRYGSQPNVSGYFRNRMWENKYLRKINSFHAHVRICVCMS